MSANDPLPIVLVPGLAATPLLYADQIPALWRFGSVTIADHTRDDSMAGIARRLLAAAPPRFALAGLSMGGYIAFEVMRQAPERIVKLALLDTSARADTPEQTQARRTQMDMARTGRYAEVAEVQLPRLLSRAGQADARLRDLAVHMMVDVGPETFIRQQTAIMGRPDSRPDLGGIRCPTLVLVGDQDELTPPERAAEIADGIPGARLVTVPGSGHLSSIERPAAVTRALVDWLTLP